MTRQILIGGALGSVVLFLASSVWHIALPFGEVGVKVLPQEDLTITAMRATISDSGFYLFPSVNNDAPQADADKFLEKYRQGPTGVLIYQRGGAEFSFPKLLLNQFLIGLVAALFVSWLLAMAAGSLPSYGQRVLFVTVVALFAALYIDLPYINWYRFPANYAMSHAGGVVFGWVVTGLALAAIIKRPAGAAA